MFSEFDEFFYSIKGKGPFVEEWSLVGNFKDCSENCFSFEMFSDCLLCFWSGTSSDWSSPSSESSFSISILNFCVVSFSTSASWLISNSVFKLGLEVRSISMFSISRLSRSSLNSSSFLKHSKLARYCWPLPEGGVAALPTFFSGVEA